MAYGAAAIEGRRGLPEPPAEAAHVWGMFCDLSAARGAGVPISYQEIAAYSAVTGMAPTPWEVEQIKRLDNVALQVWADRMAKKPQRSRVAGHDAAGIDRVLGRVARND